MTGIAVVTTRLSSVTMNTAIDVMASAQRAFGLIARPVCTRTGATSVGWGISSGIVTFLSLAGVPAGIALVHAPEGHRRREGRRQGGRGAAEAHRFSGVRKCRALA